MWAAPPAVAVAAAVVVEPRVPAVVGLAHLPVLVLALDVARRAHRVPLRPLAPWPVLARAHPAVPAVRPAVVALAVLVARRPAAAPLVGVRSARLLNRQWCSAAMARTTP